MTTDALPFTAVPAGPRGLWQALVDADAARSSVTEVETTGGCSAPVIDLADRTRAHLAYLEHVAAVSEPAACNAVGDSSGVIERGNVVVVDLDAHRSRRSLIA